MNIFKKKANEIPKISLNIPYGIKTSKLVLKDKDEIHIDAEEFNRVLYLTGAKFYYDLNGSRYLLGENYMYINKK